MKLSKGFVWLVLILIVVFIVRIPSLLEPYWYGDEAIYLAIGQAINRGSVLYRDIWDNKTPILYLIYAIHPELWWAKLAATISVLGSCVGIFFLSKNIFGKRKAILFPLLATTVSGILLSIPFFEGTIANAELFFILPVVWGAYLIITLKGVKSDIYKLFSIGLLGATAFLIKVPALLDFIGMFLFTAVFLFEMLWDRKKPLIFFRSLGGTFLPIFSGFILLVFIFSFYFFLNAALSDFLVAAFSQNAAYVAVGAGPLSKFSNPLFIKFGILLTVSIVSIALYIRKIISKELLFLTLWFSFSLFGALISGRNYMHYLLQVIPVSIIFLIYLIINIKRYFIFLIILIGIIYYILNNFWSAFHLHAIPYYKNFYQFSNESKTKQDYFNFFDKRVTATYKIADFIKKETNEEDKLFLWADAANIYVLSERIPATKFIQAHHLTTVDQKNYNIIVNVLKETSPRIIIIKDGGFKFDQLNKFVKQKYTEVNRFGDLVVYRYKI